MSSSKSTSTSDRIENDSLPRLEDDFTPSEKIAFVRAMYRGIDPGTDAAAVVERKRATPDTPRVEIVRRDIPAPSAVGDSDSGNAVSKLALRLAAEITAAVENGKVTYLEPQVQQALMSAICRLYAANADSGNQFDVLGAASPVTATEALVVCGALLSSVDIQPFELSIWQSWNLPKAQ